MVALVRLLFQLSVSLTVIDAIDPCSDQLVTLATVTPPIQVRITGITLDYGLLRTIPERRILSNPYFSYGGGSKEEYIDLQPDGNSFDMMSGMIKSKH